MHLENSQKKYFRKFLDLYKSPSSNVPIITWFCNLSSADKKSRDLFCSSNLTDRSGPSEEPNMLIYQWFLLFRTTPDFQGVTKCQCLDVIFVNCLYLNYFMKYSYIFDRIVPTTQYPLGVFDNSSAISHKKNFSIRSGRLPQCSRRMQKLI